MLHKAIFPLFAAGLLAACQSAGDGGLQHGGAPFPRAFAVATVTSAGLMRSTGTPGETYFFCEPPRCRSDTSATFGIKPQPDVDRVTSRQLGEALVGFATIGGAVTHFVTRSGEPGFTVHGVARDRGIPGLAGVRPLYATITVVFMPGQRRSVSALSRERAVSLRLGGRGMVE